MDNFYCVFNPERGEPTVRHPSFVHAQREAERLARLNPGQSFYVMGTMGLAHVPQPVVFRRSNLNVENPEIPF